MRKRLKVSKIAFNFLVDLSERGVSLPENQLIIFINGIMKSFSTENK